MKKTLVLLILTSIINPLWGEKITIEGSTTVLPITQRAAEVYMRKNTGKNVIVKGGGSGVGIISLIDGVCDIASSSRSIKEKELNLAKKKGRELKGHIIAMDGLAVIVHPSNPIDNITKETLQKIYTGKIKNWKEIGGKDMKIIVVSRDSSSGTFEFFTEFVLDKKRTIPAAIMQASNNGVLNFVAQTPGAIGYVGYGYLSEKVKALKYEGVELTIDNVLKNKYKLIRPLYMYTLSNPSNEVVDFINFLKSPEGQKVVEEEGFIPLR